jgi:uncharacterized alkaline shock family protein YloU
MSEQGWERLPCGHDKTRLLALVADRAAIPAESHEAGCPYCQAALAELTLLWTPVAEWSRRPVSLPTGLLHTVIIRVRRIAQSPHHVVATASKGATTLTSWVVALLSAEAIRQVPGVASVGQAQVEPRSSASAMVRRGADAIEVSEVGSAAVSLEFSISTYAGNDLVDVADAVRQRVINELAQSASLHVEDVDVVVGDVIDGGDSGTEI